MEIGDYPYGCIHQGNNPKDILKDRERESECSNDEVYLRLAIFSISHVSPSYIAGQTQAKELTS